MAGLHHQLNGHEFEQTQGDSKVQGCLVCYSSWGLEESHKTQGKKNSNMYMFTHTRIYGKNL